MKKLILGLMLLSATSVFAEGYQINLQSTKQAGMAHTGAAMKLGSESMHFNPAALVYMKGNVDFSVGGSAVMATAKYNDGMGYTAKTDNTMGTPFYLYAGFNIYEDKLAAGVSLTTPFGNSLNWSENWKGASIVQNIALQSFRFQPTLSYKIMDKLSIGVGADITWGNFELSRAMMTIDELILAGGGSAFDPLKGNNAASATLSGDGNIKVGFNVGLMYDISDKVTVGLTYRSKVMMEVAEGDAKMTYLNSTIEGVLGAIPTFPKLNQGTFSAELPLPANTTLAVSYKVTPRLLLAFDLQYTQWGAYDKLDVVFTENVLNGYSISATKNYKNTFAYRLGAQYELTERLDIRGGVYYDETPVRSDYYNPETPGADKIGVTLGLSFEPYENLSIDIAAAYLQGGAVDGSYTTKNALNQPVVFSGEYKSYAFMPSIGVSYNF